MTYCRNRSCCQGVRLDIFFQCPCKFLKVYILPAAGPNLVLFCQPFRLIPSRSMEREIFSRLTKCLPYVWSCNTAYFLLWFYRSKMSCVVLRWNIPAFVQNIIKYSFRNKVVLPAKRNIVSHDTSCHMTNLSAPNGHVSKPKI